MIVGDLFDESKQGGGARPRNRLRANRPESTGGFQGDSHIPCAWLNFARGATPSLTNCHVTHADVSLSSPSRPVGPRLQVPRQCSQPPLHPERLARATPPGGLPVLRPLPSSNVVVTVRRSKTDPPWGSSGRATSGRRLRVRCPQPARRNLTGLLTLLGSQRDSWANRKGPSATPIPLGERNR